MGDGHSSWCYTSHMTVAELRHQAKSQLDGMTPERLKVATDFLAYLEEREVDEPTEELLALPGFLEAISSAEEAIGSGRLTAIEDLRRKAREEGALLPRVARLDPTIQCLDIETWGFGSPVATQCRRWCLQEIT